MTFTFVIIASIILIAVAAVSSWALLSKNQQLVLRLMASIVLICLGLFSAFGYLASHEPGVGVGWRIGYGLVGTLCVTALGRLWLVGGRRQRG